MGFWDTIKKVDKTLVTAGGTVAAVGAGLGAIAKSKHNKEMKEREMALKEQNAAADREYRMKKLEQEERLAALNAEASIQKANIMYGEKKVSNSVFFDRENGVVNKVDYGQTQQQMMGSNAMSGVGAGATDVQQKILDAHNMMVNGIITEDEFRAMKAQILMGK